MPDEWITYYKEDDGTIISHGTVPPDTLPAGVVAVSHGLTRMDQGNRWNPLTRTWELSPPEVLVDRLQDLINAPGLAPIWSRLTIAQRLQLRKTFVWLLGNRRYRQPGEEVSLDVPPSWPTDPAQVNE